ncbi:MAG: YceI family protein, partial [Myxococcales bacterium]
MGRFGPDTATCEVFTYREGILAAVGHDLKLRAERFEIDADATSVRARFDPSSLRVSAAMRGGREDPAALSERDRREIERSCAREVLEAERFPEITFTSTEMQHGSVRGTLSLHGRELSGEFAVKRSEGRAVAEVELDVRRFGIRPFTAMLGALRVSPMVRVVVSTPW